MLSCSCRRRQTSFTVSASAGMGQGGPPWATDLDAPRGGVEVQEVHEDVPRPPAIHLGLAHASWPGEPGQRLRHSIQVRDERVPVPSQSPCLPAC